MVEESRMTSQTSDQARTPEDSARYYGRLATVALHFYVVTGLEAERNAAYWYARYAARAVLGGRMP